MTTCKLANCAQLCSPSMPLNAFSLQGPTTVPLLPASAFSYWGISAPCTRPQAAAPHLSTCGISRSPGSPCRQQYSPRSHRCPVSQLSKSQNFHNHPPQLKKWTPVGASLQDPVRSVSAVCGSRGCLLQCQAVHKQQQNSPDLFGCLKGTPAWALPFFFSSSFQPHSRRFSSLPCSCLQATRVTRWSWNISRIIPLLYQVRRGAQGHTWSRRRPFIYVIPRGLHTFETRTFRFTIKKKKSYVHF